MTFYSHLSILRILRITLHQTFTRASRASLDSLSSIFMLAYTLRIILHSIVTIISRALFKQPHIRLFSFIAFQRQYLVHFQDSYLLDCYVSILRAFLLHWIVTMASRAALGFSSSDFYVRSRALSGFLFIGLLHQYLERISLALDCYDGISCSSRILLHLIFT